MTSGEVKALPRLRVRALGVRSGRPVRKQAVARAATRLVLNEQRLIDGFMADAHGVIVREVDREPAGDLLRAPGVCPPPILPPSMSTAFPGHGWARHKSPARSDDAASQ